MGSSSLQYLVRTHDGKEYGPVDQDTLIQWAQTGRITSQCEIRNKLLNKWAKAESVSFLKGLVSDPVMEAKKADTMGKKWWRFVTKQEREIKEQKGLQAGGTFKYTPAGSVLRAGAWLLDIAVLALVGTLGIGIASSLIQSGAGDAEQIYVALSLILFLVIVGYYTLLWAFSAQTLGEWFWGIMVIRTDGDPVLLLRALIYTILHLALFWTTPVFTIVIPSKRAIQDKLAGVRIVRIKVTSI